MSAVNNKTLCEYNIIQLLLAYGIYGCMVALWLPVNRQLFNKMENFIQQCIQLYNICDYNLKLLFYIRTCNQLSIHMHLPNTVQCSIDRWLLFHISSVSIQKFWPSFQTHAQRNAYNYILHVQCTCSCVYVSKLHTYTI